MKAKAAPKPKPDSLPKRPRKPRVLAPRTADQRKHGTPWGVKYCTGTCPNVAKGGLSCHQANRAYQNAYVAKRRAGVGTPIVHGNTTGYQMGCHKREDCPNPAGSTCAEVMHAYGQARKAKAKAA